MNENTKNLKTIYEYCKKHKHIDGRYFEGPCTSMLNGTCALYRSCIETDKRSRYNDPRFVNKCVAKVERALKKEEELANNDPFKEVVDET